MRFNNRMPRYVPKELNVPKPKHREKKNGVFVFVDGERLDPYKDVPASSLSLSSRISTGTFEDHEGHPFVREKVSASDMINETLEHATAEISVKNAKVESQRAFKAMQERGKKALKDAMKKEVD